jgi:tellurite resistance protein TerC
VVCSDVIDLRAAAEGIARLNLDVGSGVWMATAALIAALVVVDVFVIHRHERHIGLRRASTETVLWLGIGVAFGVAVIGRYGGTAGTQWFSGYLIELSLSVDNVFVWSLILTHFLVPPAAQHRGLFFGILAAIVLRIGFILVGVEVVNRFEWVTILFGAFLLYTAFKLMVSDEDDEVDPEHNVVLRYIRRVIPSTTEYASRHLFTRVEGRRLATPLLAVVIMLGTTDVLFAVDSVPAVLAVSREKFIVLTSNCFAILGLRAMYFLLADMRARFSYLQQGLAIILAFVGIKMIIGRWYEIPTPVSLIVIGLVLAASVAFSLRRTRGVDTIELAEAPPPPDER